MIHGTMRARAETGVMTKILRLDHVNILTANLGDMIAWYGDILDMHPGPRPPFSNAGAWLYANEIPCVHLVEVSAPQKTVAPKIEHFAFAATGMVAFLAKLEDRGVDYTLGEVPDTPLIQVNISDVDGNHIHVDFSSDEQPSKN
jgi:catechol 2,3-dioxygenase-like lactoylglutathione lyase family enzyme